MNTFDDKSNSYDFDFFKLDEQLNQSVKSRETESCVSAMLCRHQHKHDHFKDHIKHVLKDRFETNVDGRLNQSHNHALASLSAISREEEMNFLLEQKKEWLKKPDQCAEHAENGSCCSDFEHCDGVSGGHCNGHE